MFKQEADWSNAITVISDVMRGSSALSVETRSSGREELGNRTHFSRWRYEQVQPHRGSADASPRLFTDDHLATFLEELGSAKILFAYQAPVRLALGAEMNGALAEFSSIRLDLVTLEVGSVNMSWLLVSLAEQRDVILWKMKYHLRDIVLPGSALHDAVADNPDEGVDTELLRPEARTLLDQLGT